MFKARENRLVKTISNRCIIATGLFLSFFAPNAVLPDATFFYRQNINCLHGFEQIKLNQTVIKFDSILGLCRYLHVLFCFYFKCGTFFLISMILILLSFNY